MSVAPFLQKTYEILSNPAHADICGWGEKNDSIFITNIDEFARVVLPKYFKHSKYSSFTRQLYKYDFHKTEHNSRHGEFKHPYFMKDQPEMMVFILRKTKTKVFSEQSSSSEEPKEESLTYEQCDEMESTTEPGMLARDEEKLSVLEKRQAHLITENEEMRNLIHETVQQNNHMIHTMDMILNSAMCNVDLAEKGLPLNVPELTERKLNTLFQVKCKVFGPVKRLMKGFKKVK